VTIQFFAVGQEATGVIAVGQMATGVIAIGQMATGVIAIGQLSRGVVAIGMLSVGLVSVGMLSFGLVYCVGMLGAGGMRGAGFVIPLVPILPKRPKLPGLGSLAAIAQGRGAGWLRGLVQRADGAAGFRVAAGDRFALATGGQALVLDVPPALTEGTATAASEGIEVVALVERTGDGVFSLRRLMRAGSAPITPQWLAIAAAQLVGLVIGAYLYFQFVLVDLGDMLLTLYRGLS
jgi:hypothetical protein